MNIVLLNGQSQYGAQRLHIVQLTAALRELGHEVGVIDLTTQEGFRDLERIAGVGVDFVFAFNAMGAVLNAGGQSLYDLLKVPFLTLLLDHPVYHLERLAPAMATYAPGVLDRSHLDFLRRQFDPGHHAMRWFMPPGANVVKELSEDAFERFHERSIDVLFTGTYRGVPERAWAAMGSSFIGRVLEDAADLAIAHDDMPVEAALDEVLRVRDVELGPRATRKLLVLSAAVQDYLSAYRRHSLLVALSDAGVPLTIYGNGWADHMSRFPHFTYGGEGSFEQTLDLVQDTKIVLNSNNNFVWGGHERVFAAMMGGAAVVSDFSRYYDESFADGTEIALFRWTKLNDAGSMIRGLLADTERLRGIARAGYENVRANHTWKKRAEYVISVAQAAMLLAKK